MKTDAPHDNKVIPPATRREILAWACYDIANSTYAVVVATAVYNAYYVHVVARSLGKDLGTFLLTIVICISSLLIVISAPVIGTVCDALASKKKMLLISTAICIVATATLFFVRPGHFVEGALIMIVANVAFGTGEDLVAAFLPELAHTQDMGRISAIGWAAGYVGGLFALAACGVWIRWAQGQGMVETQYVPIAMVLCAVLFAVCSAPTFLILRERAEPDPLIQRKNYILVGFERLKHTISHARHYRDLFSFLITLFFYSCGTTTVFHLASVYAQEVFGFTPQDLVKMMLVVSVTAALGAALFGQIQDRIGSIKTLASTLCIWTVAILIASFARNGTDLWIAAILIGLCMGASGSVGRALVGQFAPRGRSGEFLGLWGMAVKLATCVGALSFGTITVISHSNFRLALLSTVGFFVMGFIMLFRVNEERGHKAALEEVK